MPRFAEPADDQLAPAREDQVHGLLERLTQAIRERIEGPSLVVKDRATELEDADR
jgi:hypothetical protein